MISLYPPSSPKLLKPVLHVKVTQEKEGCFMPINMSRFKVLSQSLKTGLHLPWNPSKKLNIGQGIRAALLVSRVQVDIHIVLCCSCFLFKHEMLVQNTIDFDAMIT